MIKAFHKETIDLLKDQSVSVEDVHHPLLIEQCRKQNKPIIGVSDIQLNQLECFAKDNNIKFPKSFQEWMLFSKSRLWVMKLTKRVLNISAVNSFVLYEWEKQKILSFCVEDNGYCEWGILLNGSEDPPVLTKLYEDDVFNWCEAASSFSQFIFDALNGRKIVFPSI